jgi:hypothetical protein
MLTPSELKELRRVQKEQIDFALKAFSKKAPASACPRRACAVDKVSPRLRRPHRRQAPATSPVTEMLTPSEIEQLRREKKRQLEAAREAFRKLDAAKKT